MSNPLNSGLCITEFAMADTMNHRSSASKSSARSSPTNAWRNPMTMTISSAKKMSDSFIMTFSTTSMAPKNRKLSRYSSRRVQNIGALKARKL